MTLFEAVLGSDGTTMTDETCIQRGIMGGTELCGVAQGKVGRDNLLVFPKKSFINVQFRSEAP